jgi:cation diffusion facilitator family transporter
VTVLLAGLANVLIAAAKLVAGLLTGSSAMLSEAAHSFADTLNEAFLLTALRRSKRPADTEHPFGYGMERYFWSFLAAVTIFVLGAGFSILQGVAALVSPRSQADLGLGLAVLAVSFCFDGASLLRALWQLRGEARVEHRSVVRHILRDADPAVRAVAFEDLVAVVGVVLAAAGLVLDDLTGSSVYDAIASIAIGVLLIGVAYALGRQNQELLIGRAVDDEALADFGTEIGSSPGIDRVVQIMTMRLAPDEVMLAARVEVAPETSGADLALLADDIDAHVQERFPEVRHVFLDPTPPG